MLVHTGNGKGKSSSVFGVIGRALGWGHDVGLVQYIKGTWKTGERNFFKQFEPGLRWHTMGEGFTSDTQDRQRDIAAAKAALHVSAEMLSSGDFDLIVLDEINIVLRYGYLTVEQVLDVLAAWHQRTRVILTGRDAKPELIEAADLVTEMKEIKHPFQQGIKAKQGNDFWRSLPATKEAKVRRHQKSVYLCGDIKHNPRRRCLIKALKGNPGQRESADNPELYPQL